MSEDENKNSTSENNEPQEENSRESTVSLSSSHSSQPPNNPNNEPNEPKRNKKQKRQKPQKPLKTPSPPFTGYDAPPLLCFLLLGFTFLTLSLGFLITAFQDPQFQALVQFQLRQTTFDIFQFGNEVADMKFNTLNVVTELVQTNPDGTTIVTASPTAPVLVKNAWLLGDFQIPFKIVLGTMFTVKVTYGNVTNPFVSEFVIPVNGEFTVKPYEIAFLASPDAFGRYLRPFTGSFENNFIGISPIQVKIYSEKAPEIAFLELGSSGISSRIWWFLGLFILGSFIFFNVLIFILFAVSLQNQSNGANQSGQGGAKGLKRAYQFSGEFEVNRYPPIQYQ